MKLIERNSLLLVAEMFGSFVSNDVLDVPQSSVCRAHGNIVNKLRQFLNICLIAENKKSENISYEDEINNFSHFVHHNFRD